MFRISFPLTNTKTDKLPTVDGRDRGSVLLSAGITIILGGGGGVKGYELNNFN